MQIYGGISRYFIELYKRFNFPNSLIISGKYSNNKHLNITKYQKKEFFPNYHFPGRTFIMNQINLRYSVSSLNFDSYDIFHPTYYNSYFLKYIKHKPFVITFHDLIHERLDCKFIDLKKYQSERSEKIKVIDRASKIISVSENTKRDLIDFYKVPEEKINVIHLASELDISAYDISKKFTREYILYVGNRDGYKNFIFFLKSIRDLLFQNDIVLLCAGGGVFSREEKELLDHLNLKNKVFYRPILSDNDLANYYTYARLFVFPSLYEGFGIPILEAFQFSCPVVLSNTSSFPEVAGDAGRYFTPTDSHSIYDSVYQTLFDSNGQKRMKELSAIQYSKFSWQMTYENTLLSYNSASPHAGSSKKCDC